VELLKAAEEVGFTACDCIVKDRKAPIRKSSSCPKASLLLAGVSQVQEVRMSVGLLSELAELD
jgi:hypothetical protein